MKDTCNINNKDFDVHLFQSFMSLSDPAQLNTIVPDVPCHLYWKDCQGKYLASNDCQAKSLGLQKGNDLLGKTDFELCWHNEATFFRENDLKVMTLDEPLLFLEGGTFPDGSKMRILSHKAPLRIHKKITGIIGLSLILNDSSLFKIDLSQRDDSWELLYLKDPTLTQRQEDCLFHLVTGKPIKQIAKILNLSPKTVGHYLERVKIKLACSSRSELIDRALTLPAIKLRLLLRT